MGHYLLTPGNSVAFGLAANRPQTGANGQTYFATDTGVVSYYDAANSTWYSPSASVIPYDQAVLSDNPIAFYRLLESSGTAAADALGNNPGTWGAVPTRTTAPNGVGGYAITAAGMTSTTALSLGSPTDLQITGTITFEILVNFEGNGNLGGGLMGAGTYGGWVLDVASSQLRLMKSLSGPAVQSTLTISDSNWHHIVATSDGTAANSHMYIDGVNVSGSQANVTPNAPGTMYVGYGTPNGPLTCQFAKAAIYTTQLSAARALAHYEAFLGQA